MIILICGASHTGDSIGSKNIRKISIPYLLIDHLKMRSIRSGKTNLTPEMIEN